MRDLRREKENILTVVETWSDGHGPTHLETIALHAIDRAIAAEKERDELRKRVEELEMNLDKQKVMYWLKDRCDLYSHITPLRPIRASEVCDIITEIQSGRFDAKEEPCEAS